VRTALQATTALSGLIDTSGAAIPSTRPAVDVRTLPLIDPDALPPMPEGFEARLHGDDEIVVWWPAQGLHAAVPLLERETAIPEAVAAMISAAGGAIG